MSGEKRCRRVTSAALMRSPIVDLDQLLGDDRIVSVCFLEKIPDASPGYDRVEHRSPDNGRIHGELTCFSCNARRAIKADESCRCDENNGREPLRIARTENNGVGTGEGSRYKHTRIADYLIDEIGNQ